MLSEAGFCRNSPNLNHEGGVTAPGRFREPGHTSSNSCTKLANSCARPAAALGDLWTTLLECDQFHECPPYQDNQDNLDKEGHGVQEDVRFVAGVQVRPDIVLRPRGLLDNDVTWAVIVNSWSNFRRTRERGISFTLHRPAAIARDSLNFQQHSVNIPEKNAS